ncbi:type I 3-dehydroquinate dehydratase [Leuconostoc palmae]|uniref:type I 3-dehydroquinate dehydratase n=1 Tax=Leuconostoc palmae TaxID=501487 RepID=UPI001C7CA20E|nr:type I 3-dehydroquinate dehydratase [Leuconostoc palmae]
MTLRKLLKLQNSINDKPVIAVPLDLGPNDKLTPFAKLLQEKNPDVVEWRADYIADAFSQAMIWQQVKVGAQAEITKKNVSAMTEAKMLAEMDAAQEEFKKNWPAMNAQIIKELTGSVFNTIGSFPIILTYRTCDQGGRGELSPVEYATFIISALRSGYHFSAVDVEFTTNKQLRETIVQVAKENNVPVILSYHNFESTPDINHLINQMTQVGSDIIKIAVTPNSTEDVQSVLDATKNANVNQPLITIAMGELGKITRIKGYIYGSEMTFAALSENQVSAPGQLTVDELLASWQK